MMTEKAKVKEVADEVRQARESEEFLGKMAERVLQRIKKARDDLEW